jgi:hypothetical protein
VVVVNTRLRSLRIGRLQSMGVMRIVSPADRGERMSRVRLGEKKRVEFEDGRGSNDVQSLTHDRVLSISN